MPDFPQNEYINKVIYGNDTLIDLSNDTVTENDVLSGKDFHLPNGAPASGAISQKTAATYYPSASDQVLASGQYLSGAQTIKGVVVTNLDAASIKSGVQVTVGDSALPSRIANVTGTFTSDANATAAEILSSKTAYVNGNKITGTMPNIGVQNSAISSVAQQIAIQKGYHDGSGKVSIASAEQSKLIPDNIREGITVLGVLGTMSGSEDVKATALSVTPYITASTYLPTGQGDYNYFSQVSVASIAYSEQLNDAGGYTATIGTVAPSS